MVSLMHRRRMMMQTQAAPPPSANLLYNWDFKNSLVDTVSEITATTTGVMDNTGIYFGDSQKYISCPGVYAKNRTFWVYFADFNTRKGGTNNANGRIICASNSVNTGSYGSGFIYRSTGVMEFYLKNNGGWAGSSISASGKYDYFANSILKMYVDSDGCPSIYKDSTLVLSTNKAITYIQTGDIVIGGSNTDCAAYLKCTGIKVYDGFYI